MVNCNPVVHYMSEGVIWQYFCKRFAFMYYWVYVVAAFLKHLLLIGGNSVTRGYMPLLWLWGLYCFCWFDWSRAVRKPGGHRDERAKTGTGKKSEEEN